MCADMKPRYVLEELRQLSALVAAESVAENLRGVHVLITHVQPLGLLAGDGDTSALPKRILKQLRAHNDLNVQFALAPAAGRMLTFD